MLTGVRFAPLQLWIQMPQPTPVKVQLVYFAPEEAQGRILLHWSLQTLLAPSFAVTCAHLPYQSHSTIPILSAPLTWVGRCLCVLVSIFGCEVGSGCHGCCGSELWPHSPVQDKEVKHMAATGIAVSALPKEPLSCSLPAGKRWAAVSLSAGLAGSDWIKCLSAGVMKQSISTEKLGHS